MRFLSGDEDPPAGRAGTTDSVDEDETDAALECRLRKPCG